VRLQAATPLPPARLSDGAPAPGASRLGAPTLQAARLTGLLGLLGLLVTTFLLSAGASSGPGRYVPARSGGWHGWLAGPLAGLRLPLTTQDFQTLTLLMCASYALVLLTARVLPLRAIAIVIVLAHVILLLGPPLLSQDVFGYLGFARLGALHGLDPYTHVAAEAPGDPVFGFLGWPFENSPYGPLFTLTSYGAAPLGLAGGLWALKAAAALASLGAVALCAYAARRCGHSAAWAAAFVGCNPVLLELAVGGAHNDTLVILTLALALALAARTGAAPAGSRLRASACSIVAGIGVKASAGIVLPFVVLAPAGWRERARVALTAVLALAALALLGVIGFGTHTFGFLGAIGEQQHLVAPHSVPAETARLLGLSGTPQWWRELFLAAFALATVVLLVRTARGGIDWRVAAGWATLALLLATAWLLPWYAVWLLPLAAVSGDRRLCAATLLFCAYALLIHLPVAEPLLTPALHRAPAHLHLSVPGLRNRLKFAGFQILHDVLRNLRW